MYKRQVLLADALGYLTAAALVTAYLRSGRPRDEADRGQGTGVLRDSWSGISDVMRVRSVRRGMLLGWLVPFFVVAPEALGAPYISQSGLPASAVGAWYVAMPLGNLVGALAGVWFLDARRRRRLIRGLAVTEAAVLVPVAMVAHVGVAWLLLLASGLASVFGLGLDQYLLDATPAPLLSRMFTLQATGLMTLQGLGFAVWGALGELAPAAAVIGVAGAAGALVAVLVRLPSLPVRDAEPAPA